MLDVRAVLIRGTSTAFGIYVSGAAITFALHVLLARIMGVEHYGVYVYVLAWLNILVLFAKLGMDTASLRFVAAYAAREEWGALSGILRYSALLVLATSILVSGVGIIAVWVLQERISLELAHAFWFGFALLPIMALAHIRQAALRALRRVASAQIPEFVLRPLLLAALVVALFYFGSRITGDIAMALDLAAASVAFLVGSLWLYRGLPTSLKGIRPVYRSREWFVVGLPLFLMSGMYLAHYQIDVLMIGSILGAREAGIYAVATRMATVVLLGLIAVNAIAASMISEFYATDRIDELQRMVSFAARGILAISVPIGLGLVVLGQWGLSFFGPEFSEGYVALVILTAGQLINALAGSVGFLMTMTGHEREAAYIMAVSAIVNVGLNAVLIPAFGLEGAAFATAFSTALWNGVMLVYVQKRLGINSTGFRVSWQRAK